MFLLTNEPNDEDEYEKHKPNPQEPRCEPTAPLYLLYLIAQFLVLGGPCTRISGCGVSTPCRRNHHTR